MSWLTILGYCKQYKNWITVLVVIAAFAIGFVASKFLPHDSPIEQVAEQVIEKTSGIKLDFTPGN